MLTHKHYYTHTHYTPAHIFLQFSSISFPLTSFCTQCLSLSIVEMCMWREGEGDLELAE